MKPLIYAFMLACALPALADPPAIESVTATENHNGWRFDVALRHPDSGWDHYADGWRVLNMDGEQIGLRVLHHPHVNEQPFTRSLPGVQIPPGTSQVQIQARCLVDGWNRSTVIVALQ